MFTTTPGVPTVGHGGDRGALRPRDPARGGRTRTGPTRTVALRVRRRRRLPGRAAWPTRSAPPSEIDRHEQALPDASATTVDGLKPGTLYHYRAVGDERGRRRQCRTRRTFTTFAFTPRSTTTARTPTCASRPAPPCCSTAAPTSWSPPPTPAATTSSRPGRRADAVRRLSRRARPRRGPLRGPRRRDPGHRQPDQPRRRSLRRDPRRRRLDDRIRRHPGRHSLGAALRLDPGRSRRRPRHLRLRRPRHLLAVLRRRQAPAIPSTCPTAAWSRAWRARSTQARVPQPAGFVGKRPLGRRHALRLRLDLAVRARRQRQRRRLDLRPRPDHRTTHVVSKTPGRRDDDRRRASASSTSPPTARGSWSASWSHEAGRATLLAPLHERRRLRQPSTSRPARRAGALYDGMTADGSKVFFTTADQLARRRTPTPAPTSTRPKWARRHRHAAACLHRHRRDRQHRLPAIPSANTVTIHWNTTGAEETCGAVAVGGGGGVAQSDGTIYFLSPEQLDGSGNGVQNAPNLYVARPGLGAALRRAPWSRAPTRRCRSPAIPFIRAFGSASESRPGSRSTTPTGDIYVLDIGGQSAARLRLQVRLRRARRDELRQQRQTDGVRACTASTTCPTEIAVDNDPTSPNYGDLYVPDVQEGIVNKYDASAATSSHQHRHPAIPTGVAVDPDQRQRLRRQRCFGGRRFRLRRHRHRTRSTFPIACSFPTGRPGSRSTRPATSTSSTAAARPRKGTTEMYSSTGTDLGQFDPDSPSYARRGRPDRRPRLRRPRQQVDRVRLSRQSGRRRRSARRHYSHSISASPPTGGNACDRQPQPAAMPRPTGPRPCPPTRHRQPAGRRQRQRRRHPRDRRLPGHAVGRRRGLHLDPAADRYDNAATARSSATTRPATARLRLLQPDRRAGDRRGDAGRRRPQPHRRRPRLLQLDRSPGRPRPEQQGGRLRVGAARGLEFGHGARRMRQRRRLHRADLDRHQPVRLEPARRQRRRHRRLLLHPRHAGPQRRKREQR